MIETQSYNDSVKYRHIDITINILVMKRNVQLYFVGSGAQGV